MVPAFLGEDMTLICRKMSNCNLLCYSRIGSIIKRKYIWEKNMKKRRISYRIGSIAVIALFELGGICLIALANIPFKNPYIWWEAWGRDTASNAGTTILVAGIISLLIEISTLKNFFQDSMKNILNEDFPFSAYSEENLVNFKNLISSYLIGNTMSKEELKKDTIYSYEDQLLQLAKGKYYDYHRAEYTVYPDEEKEMIRINATIDYRIINKEGEKNEIRFKTKSYALKDTQDSFNLKKLTINRQEVETKNLVKIERIDKQEESNFYDYKVKIEKDLGKIKKNDVHIEYEYWVPMYDKLQNYKITLPCRNLVHRIRIKNNWELRGSAYTAFYYRQGEADAKYKIEQSLPDAISINFNGWIFPGAGYSVYYDQKNCEENEK